MSALSIEIPFETVKALSKAAAARDMSVAMLSREMLAIIGEDAMADAIMDDGCQSEMRARARSSALERRLAEAQAEIARLRGEVDVTDRIALRLGLTASQRRVLGLLLASDRVTKETLSAATHGADATLKASAVESHVSNVRKALAPYGVKVLSQRFGGYWIEDRLAVRQMLLDAVTGADRLEAAE